MRKNWQNLGFLSLFFSQIFKGERKNCFQAIGYIYNFIFCFLLKVSHEWSNLKDWVPFVWFLWALNLKKRLLRTSIYPPLNSSMNNIGILQKFHFWQKSFFFRWFFGGGSGEQNVFCSSKKEDCDTLNKAVRGVINKK